MTNMQQTKLFDDRSEKKQGPVECLGMTFENDNARRAYFIGRLQEKLKDPEFRKIEGFPIGMDEDILRLSDPPYYTACPNPFIEETIDEWKKEREKIRFKLGLQEERYQREPFAADVFEGKNDPIYNAHSYHTKVPHKAIMRYILHYTEPGDIVFDGFCGSGMTGVAAKLCSSHKEVESLGYIIDNLGMVREGEKIISPLGVRKALLNDLSPVATFIAQNYNTPVDLPIFERDARQILHKVEEECGWMYETWHPHCDNPKRAKARINYTVWSEVQTCPNCAQEIVFFDIVLDKDNGRLKEEFYCPNCRALLKNGQLDLLFETRFDPQTGETIKLPKRKPVLINYNYDNKKYEKKPDEYDLKIIERISILGTPDEIPFLRLPDMQMLRVGRMKTTGVTNIRHFFLPRPSQSLASLWRNARNVINPKEGNFLLFLIEQAIWGMSILSRYVPTHYSQVNQYLSGVFYVASQISEVSPWYILEGKLDRLIKAFRVLNFAKADNLISTENLGSIKIKENSVDYIFTDPPFGENIYYSDLNILIESWLKVLTTPQTETIVDRVKGKDFLFYENSMKKCFLIYYHILKPGRWITVEFHNSQNSVWNAIQSAIQAAGFVVADVRTLSKIQGSFQQVTSTTAVKQDLVISAYKPIDALEERTHLTSGTEDSAWEFVRYHLAKLPLINQINGSLLVNQERQSFLLFDRMVAFHVQRSILVPLSSAEFYAGLSQRFPERDDMYFLPEQVGEYDQERLRVHKILQLRFFVSDESGAILWLRQQLGSHPQTYQDLFPKFILEISAWGKYEKALELSEILEQNFLSYDGTGTIPFQIWTWMIRDEEIREVIKGQNRESPSAALHSLAKGRWFVPDPNNAQQLEKVREKALLKEFDGYKSFPGKTLKVFRLEAVRTGFKKAWQDRDYKTIILVAEKISEEALQEDPKLLMWYDQALTRSDH